MAGTAIGIHDLRVRSPSGEVPFKGCPVWDTAVQALIAEHSSRGSAKRYAGLVRDTVPTRPASSEHDPEDNETLELPAA